VAFQPTPTVVVCLLSVFHHTPFFGTKQGGSSWRAPHPIPLTLVGRSVESRAGRGYPRILAAGKGWPLSRHITSQPLRWSPLVSQSGAHSACKRQIFTPMDTQPNALPTLPVLARTSSDAGLRRPVCVTALRRADVFAFEPGPASRKHGPTPKRCLRQEPLGRNGPGAFTLCHRASGLFRAPFALPSQLIQGREVEMTVQCQNRANSAGVYRFQIGTYSEKAGSPARALMAAETSETST